MTPNKELKGYYPVDFQSSEFGIDCRFLFKPMGKPNAGDLADALRDSLRKITYPDLVLIVVLPSDVQEIEDLCTSDLNVKQTLERASNKVTIGIVELGINGDLIHNRFVANNHGDVRNLLSSKKKAIYDCGLSHLFSTSNCKILVRSPPGFIFLKPSGQRSTYFLRAEDALYSTERVHFLACSLLTRVCENRVDDNTIEQIYVDTMGIASIAYVFRDLYVEINDIASKPSVISFHSYGGIQRVSSPFKGKALCIISASSSMNMQRDWMERTSCGKDEVITLVTLNDAEDSEYALYQLTNTHSDFSSNAATGLKDLRIVGEDFSPEEISPKEVILNAKHHKVQQLAKLAPLYSEKGVVSSFVLDEIGKQIRDIHIEGNKFVELDKTLNCAKDVVNQHLSLSTKKLIFQPDKSSEKLAQHCADFIEAQTGTRLGIVSADNLESVTFRTDDGILIVAAIVGRGTSLLSLSRDLRERHKGPRHYLIGLHLGETRQDSSMLTKNLEFSRERWSYKVSIIDSIAIGRSINTARTDEIKIMESVEISTALPDDIKARLENLKEGLACKNGSFLPPISENRESLPLRPTFALWNDSYSENDDHSGAVLATVAATLQKARESGSEVPDESRLSSDAFQQVTLDPENFARFNDGILQAALLRASDRSELDYSSNANASYKMATLLKGIFNSIDKDQGEAALEFALALATDKLKLAKQDLSEIMEFCKNNVNGTNRKKIELLQVLVSKTGIVEDGIPF